jgi:uncharacterized phage protein gp47/JayE
MAYFAPFIDATGLHLPNYDDISSYEQAQFLSVYGQNVAAGNDSADTQWIDIFSLMINDAFNTAQLAVNARSPATAVGADLDTVVKINGITRKSSTPSQVVLTCTGLPNTELDSAVAQDINGFLWDLPPVVILSGGSVNVTAVCQSDGPVAAPAGTINIRSTPIAGWTGVTNPSDAIPGTPAETDSQLRARQALSVSLSAKTLVGSTLAGIAAVPNVTRYNPGIATPGGPGTSVENPTGSTDSWGNPAHSISMVVEGGADLDVATAIYNNKTPGCLTNGTTSVPVTDPVSGAVMDIAFFRPSYVPIYVTFSIHQLNGYTSSVTAAIQTAVAAYLNGLQIGESVTISGLIFAAMSVMPNPLLPQYSVRQCLAGTAPSPTTSTDIDIDFNQVVSGNTANIIINFV